MTAWWTDMSTTANIIMARPPVTPAPRRRRLLRWRPRLRCGVASAADPGPSKLGFDGTKIGELVIVLRSECTGRRPVHFFGKFAIAAAALAAAAPTSASAEGAAAVAQSAPVRGQSVADFYRGRNDYPF